MNTSSRLVYSTATGRTKEIPAASAPPKGDGVVRIRHETSGRKGKGVTTISGIELDEKALNTLAKELKQLCGTGGTVKNFVIEIQGDHREKLMRYLQDKGHKVKMAGG